MIREVKIGQTDYTILILILDTAFAPKTGLTNASAGIDVCYTRVETDNDVVLTDGAPVALATPALTDVHLDWGFLEVNATKAPGLYRLDIADGVFASGAWSAVVSLIATGINPVHLEFILVPSSPYVGVGLDPAQAATTFAALTVTATTTLTGNVVLSDGLTVSAPSTGGRAGITITGNGTGSGIAATGGATGPGLLVSGGGNNADADGLRAVAGGALAADIDADIVGTLSGTTGGHAVGVDFTAVEKASINTEVVDTIGIDTIAEMAQGLPPATPTTKQALMYLYMAWRNRQTTTATLTTTQNDAGTVICRATLSDDATTFTKAEFVTGP